MQILPAWMAFKHRFTRGLLVNVLLLSSGALACCAAQHQESKAYALQTVRIPCILTIQDNLQRKGKSYTTLARVQMIREGIVQTMPGQCMLYLPLSVGTTDIKPGNRIYTTMPLQGIQPPRNPGEVDFKKIFARKGIYGQVYLRENRILVLAGNEHAWMRDALLAHRGLILQTLSRYIRDTAARGLAEAILIGYRVNLDQELSGAYARTGVMHVIAISGLHISLIFSILLTAFRLVPVYGKNPWLHLLLAIPAIWWFSMLTGASASVIRSAVMSTLPVLASVLRRRTDSLNVLSASALLLLAFKPGWLWDTGFQLSYAAVLGILLYQQKIQRSLYVKHPLGQASWSLVSVTLAAQVFTTPLVLFYFRQFPLFFLISNLAAVPLSSLILLSELMVCALGSQPTLAGTAGLVATELIHFLNNFITRMDRIPFSVIRNIYVDSTALCLLFGIIAGLHGFIRSGRRGWALIVVGFSLLLCTCQVLQSLEANRQSGMLVLQIHWHTAMIRFEGRTARQYLLPAPESNKAGTLAILEKARQHYRVIRHDSQLLGNASLQLLSTGHRRILVVSGHPSPFAWPGGSPPDMVLLTGNTRCSLEPIYRVTGCRLFVADGSNALWKIQQWQKESEKLPLRFHSTPQQGAFLLD
jgi:competence protein ComEC